MRVTEKGTYLRSPAAAGDDDVGIAGLDLLSAERHCAQARAAHPVHAPSRFLGGDSCSDRGLPRRGGPAEGSPASASIDVAASETPNIAAIVKPAPRTGRLIEFCSFAPPSPEDRQAQRLGRAARSLRHEPAKLLGLLSVGRHLFLGKTALHSQDVLQILGFC
jgi:hypothetical protein